VTGGQIPPLWVPLAELAWWVRDMHDLTESEIRDVVVDLRGDPSRFRVSFRPGVERAVTDWKDWVVDWEAGTVRGNRHPDGPGFALEVSWDAVAGAVVRLRMRQRREAARALAPGPPGRSQVPRRTQRQVMADVLASLHQRGVDIVSPESVGRLHTRAMEEAKIRVSKATFERALADARSLISINFPHEGDEGT
jgi:hypothetical protein